MSRTDFPKLYELKDLIENPLDPSAFFHNFEDTLLLPDARKCFLPYECAFEQLDADSWDFLKNEARPYLAHRDGNRGWSQLIDIWNQAFAHNYLVRRGCVSVRFIPEAPKKTPDLEGMLDARKVLCEVKTIHSSDVEVDLQRTGKAGRTVKSLNEGFFDKLMKTLLTAKCQMQAFDDSTAKYIAFLIVNFDDFTGQYIDDYYELIDRYLEREPVPGICIVFYNPRTPFLRQVSMRNAQVINEANSGDDEHPSALGKSH